MAKLTIKARAIDMLGRQQIAGIPTAIHELFKNAHDAYADQVAVDYFRRDALFVLRDDGIGMTEEEFQERWLTVGTDSKVEGGTLPLAVPEDVDLPENTRQRRPVLGEKGVGRLAVATIGPLVLVLTRSRRAGNMKGVTGALVHWGFFGIPGLDVDRIDIPVISLGPEERPDASLIELLKEGVIRNVDQLRTIAPEDKLSAIERQVRAFELDLPSLYDEIGEPRLDRPGDQGTHFLILPVDRILESDIDDEKDNTASNLTKALLGFSNTMVPGAPQPPITACFTDHRLDGTSHELIGERSFLTPQEFRDADHHVSGEFDEFGQFRGTVSVFGEEPVPFQVAWPNRTGRKTDCGPFSLNFAYVQGEARVSRLNPDDWARVTDKLNKIGGIYLYRDGIRVLPYGNSDYDFLDVERRRTKSAKYYFFSYRRMFGAVETTRASNSGLVEKAGREGFQENRAYREFKQILENLLTQLAATFFREDGTQAEPFLRIRAELEKNELIRRKREGQARQKRTAFARQLESFFEQADAGRPQREAEQIATEARERLRAAASATDPHSAAQAVVAVGRDVRDKVAKLQERFKVAKPQGVGLPKPLLRDWAVYRDQADRLARDVLMPLAVRLEKVLSEVIDEFHLPLEQRQVVVDAIEQAASARRSEVAQAVRTTSALAEEVRSAAQERARLARSDVEQAVTEVTTELASTDTSGMTQGELSAIQNVLRGRIEDRAASHLAELLTLRERLQAVTASGDDSPASELTEALEEQVHALREELERYVELAQLGMAVGIVQHDFVEAIRTIRADIRALKPWADANSGLQRLHSSLRTAFEHLDGYLTLLTPLNRRLYRTRVPISGEEIASFLQGAFGERFKSAGITLVATDAFRDYVIEGYPSSFYPVFVNLVDNARHWLEEAATVERRIMLDADGDIIVSDTGPGIPERDREAVFEYGFTRKREGGQGLGLFISKQVLAREGWKLELDPNRESVGARFRLVPPRSPDEEAGDPPGSET